MRKSATPLIVVLALVMALIPMASSAAGTTKSASIDLAVDRPGYWQQSDSVHVWTKLPKQLGEVAGWYIIDYSGGVSLSSDLDNATINGLCGGQGSNARWNGQRAVWSFNYSEDGTNWKSAGSLFPSLTVPANTQTMTFRDSGKSQAVYAKFIQIEFFGSLASSYDASAGGSATMTATAVPEPGTVAAACSLLAPMGFMIRRRRRAVK